MILTVTKNSGSVDINDESDLAVIEDNADDILRECAGGCGTKILFFGFPKSEDWGEDMEGAWCIECKANLLLRD